MKLSHSTLFYFMLNKNQVFSIQFSHYFRNNTCLHMYVQQNLLRGWQHLKLCSLMLKFTFLYFHLEFFVCCMCMCICASRRGQWRTPVVLLYHVPPYSLETVSLTQPVANLEGSKPQESFCLYHPQFWEFQACT